MQIMEGVSIALSSLQANKGRASLTILGVAIGVMVVMAMGSAITGINHGVTDQLEQLGPRTFFVFRFFRGGIQISDGSDEMSPWRRNPPLNLDERNRILALPSIEMVVVDENNSGSVEYGNQRLPSVSINGRGPRWLEVSGGDVFPGRSYTQIEDAAGAQVAVINQRLADEFFGHLDPIGKSIRVAGEQYRVIGVYTPPPDLFGQGNRPTIYIPHTTFDRKVPHYRGWMGFLVRPAMGVTVQEAIDDVTSVLRTMRGLRPGQDNTFSVVTQDRMLETWNNMTSTFFLIMLALSSVGLMVGGVGVVAIMMISVTERTREIGVRKALGARRYEILWQFLVEAATLTLIGGAAGMALGGLISVGIRNFTPLPAEVPLASVVAALAMSALTGIFFGLYPAAKAARLDPVEALRYE